MIVGGVWGAVHLHQSFRFGGSLYDMTENIFRFIRVIPGVSGYVKSILTCSLFASLSIILSFAVFGILTLRWGPKFVTEARCRKCKSILQGITEPRCHKCGEVI